MQIPAPDPGTVERGFLDMTGLPTGSVEQLPVVVVEGGSPGPTAWITAGVHGDEVTGVVAAQDVVNTFGTEDIQGSIEIASTVDPASLQGRIVCVPVVNPAGLRRTTRTSYYHNKDPNRSFPDPTTSSALADSVQELIAKRLFEAFEDADVLVDLHTAQANSMPYAIRHRVLYGELRDREEAESLAAELDQLMDAFELPIVTQYLPAEYVDRRLHRSVAGAALNGAGIPACTIELGGHSTVDDDMRAAGVADVFRGLVSFGLLDSVPDLIERSAPETPPPVDFRVRRHRGPRTQTPGIVRHHLGPGAIVTPDAIVAELRTTTGERLEALRAEHDGYVLGHRTGVRAYENDSIAALAIRDEKPLVGERP